MCQHELATELDDVLPVRPGNGIQPSLNTTGVESACRPTQCVGVSAAQPADGDGRKCASRCPSTDKAKVCVVRRTGTWHPLVVYDAAGDGWQSRAIVATGIRDENIVPAKSQIIDPGGIGNPGPRRPGHPSVYLEGRRPVRLSGSERRHGEAVAIEKLSTQIMVRAQVVIQSAHAVVRFTKSGEVDRKGGAVGVVAEQTLVWCAGDRRPENATCQVQHHWIRRHPMVP